MMKSHSSSLEQSTMYSATFVIFAAGCLFQASIAQSKSPTSYVHRHRVSSIDDRTAHRQSLHVSSLANIADIVDTAISNGNFKTLVTALQAADLVKILKSTGPFTVFAPTDAAFAKLPPGTVADLLKPENKQLLIEILTYHVVAGNFTAAAIIALNPPVKVETLAGLPVLVTIDGDNLKVNDATVIIADVLATNGIIHAIDTVLLPTRLRRFAQKRATPSKAVLLH